MNNFEPKFLRLASSYVQEKLDISKRKTFTDEKKKEKKRRLTLPQMFANFFTKG